MLNILVVDDDSDHVALVQEMLASRFACRGATTAAEALDVIKTGGIWLLVTDIRMPFEDGFHLIRQAKELSARLAVLVVSAFYDATEPLCRDVIARYADGALAKPIDAAGLHRCIARIAIRSTAEGSTVRGE